MSKPSTFLSQDEYKKLRSIVASHLAGNYNSTNYYREIEPQHLIDAETLIDAGIIDIDEVLKDD